MATVQRADPGARRKAIRLAALSAVLGLSVILAFDHYQDDLLAWLEGNIGFLVANPVVVFLAALGVVSPALAAGTYLLLLANRTVRGQRFPPPGYAVARDTPVVEGRQAIRRGRVIRALSLCLLCSAGAIPVFVLYVFRSLAPATQ